MKTKTIDSTPQPTIERLVFYRRILQEALAEKRETLYSHEIAKLASRSSSQVRRDLMEVGYLGHTRYGYEVASLLSKIESFLQIDTHIHIVLMGVGNLGRAILSYFQGKTSHMTMVAAFDTDPSKTGRVIHGCRCYDLHDFETMLTIHPIHVGIIAVPALNAQHVTDKLIQSGVNGILNFAPIRLHVPDSVFVENLDLTLSIEKISHFAKLQTDSRGAKE